MPPCASALAHDQQKTTQKSTFKITNFKQKVIINTFFHSVKHSKYAKTDTPGFKALTPSADLQQKFDPVHVLLGDALREHIRPYRPKNRSTLPFNISANLQISQDFHAQNQNSSLPFDPKQKYIRALPSRSASPIRT